MSQITQFNKTILTCGEPQEDTYTKIVIQDHVDNDEWIMISTEDERNIIAIPKEMINDLRAVLNNFDK